MTFILSCALFDALAIGPNRRRRTKFACPLDTGLALGAKRPLSLGARRRFYALNPRCRLHARTFCALHLDPLAALRCFGALDSFGALGPFVSRGGAGFSLSLTLGTLGATLAVTLAGAITTLAFLGLRCGIIR